jgi:hypothetical protein
MSSSLWRRRSELMHPSRGAVALGACAHLQPRFLPACMHGGYEGTTATVLLFCALLGVVWCGCVGHLALADITE